MGRQVASFAHENKFAERGCARSVNRSVLKLLRLVCDTAALHRYSNTLSSRLALRNLPVRSRQRRSSILIFIAGWDLPSF